jgi:hypothetical protein
MLTVGLVTIIFVFLVLVAVFALMAKDQNRKSQSGSPNVAGSAKQGRAPGLD